MSVEHIKALRGGGARFNIIAADGREWRVDVSRDGDTGVVTIWRDGKLTDLDVPEWEATDSYIPWLHSAESTHGGGHFQNPDIPKTLATD